MHINVNLNSRRCSSGTSLSCRAGWALLKCTGRHRLVMTMASLKSTWNPPGSRSVGTRPAPASATTTVERRAADVAVLGGSAVAFAVAYSLARRGKKVVLLPDLGLTATRPPPEAYRPLQLTHPDAAAVSIASEAAAYWRGLQAQAGGSGLQLLADCRSLDLGPLRGGAGGGGGGAGSEAGEVLARIQDACRAAGVRLGSLRSEELSGLFPALQLPAGVSGLLQPEGGVLNSLAAGKLLSSLGERQGVLLRDRLVLRGWRDQGSHFVLRASGSLLPEAQSVFEVEQLLVAPEEGAARQVLRMFGADAALQAVQGTFGRCSATAELGCAPLWRAIGIPLDAGAGPRAGWTVPELAEQPQLVTGMPTRRASGSPALKLSLGLAVDPPGGETAAADWLPGRPDRSGLQRAHRLAMRLLRGVGPALLPPSPESASAGGPEAVTAGHGAGLGSEGVVGPTAQQILEHWGDPGLYTATPDGWPLLGFLPGFEPGRALFVSTASAGFAPEVAAAEAAASGSGSRSRPEGAEPRSSGSGSGGGGGGAAAPGRTGTTSSRDVAAEAAGEDAAPSSAWLLAGQAVLTDGYQLSPLLAKMAADMMYGAARPQEVDPERVGLGRAALGTRARTEGLDPWDGLARWQDGTAFRAEAAAAREGGVDEAEAAERAEAVARGARLAGADLRPEEERAREEAERRQGRGPKVVLIDQAP